MFSFRWLIAACLGLLVYMWAQVFPGIESIVTSTSDSRILNREEAGDAAMKLASAKFGVAASDVLKRDVTHYSDSDAVGYLSKRKLLSEYNHSWDTRFPTDYYRVDLQLAGGQWLMLSLQMHSGEPVGWRRLGGTDAAGSASSETPSAAADRAAAVRELEKWGYAASDWEPTGSRDEDGALVFQSRKPPIGEAALQLLVKPGEELRYRLALPASFTAYLAEQHREATRLSAIGYIVPEIVLFVLALVYAFSYSEWTSFRRGRLLAFIFFALYIGFTLNMKAGFRSQSDSGLPVSGQSVDALLVANGVILGLTALLTYFAAVGGHGLWRAMGYKRLWPEWREADFGVRVLQGMRRGYALAFIVLGAQTLIILALGKLIGSFSASDASQSSYNLAHSWLMPLIAWCAGLSEELLFRLFGISLFRRWFAAAARLLLGREPSARAMSYVTLAAMVPPSVIWAFGHLSYPIYPLQTRLIELTLLGVLFSWFLLRFGLIAAIFAHVTLDSVLVGTQLLFDGMTQDIASGLLSFAMPALVGAAIWLLHRSGLFRSGGSGGRQTAEP